MICAAGLVRVTTAWPALRCDANHCPGRRKAPKASHLGIYNKDFAGNEVQKARREYTYVMSNTRNRGHRRKEPHAMEFTGSHEVEARWSLSN